MSSVKFQDTKSIYRNLLHFFTLRMNYHKEKLRKQSHSCIKKKKKVRYKFNQEVKLLYSEYYKTLMKETESCMNKSDDSPSS